MFLNNINYKIINSFNEISIENLFRLFLDTNNFVDMSEIILLELKIYKIIDVFLSKYMERYKYIELNILKDYASNKDLMRVSKYNTKEEIIAIIELYYRGLLIVWYKKNRDKYIIKMANIGDKRDVFISKAFISDLYF